MVEREPGAVPSSSFLDVLTGAIHTLAMHPVVVLVYTVLLLILNVVTDSVHTLLAGPAPSSGASQEVVLRYVAALLLVLTARVPLDSLLDAGILTAVHAQCSGRRVGLGLLVQGTGRYAARMFIMNVVTLLVLTASLLFFCLPMILVTGCYLRFISVYIVSEDVGVGEAFTTGTTTIVNPIARFLPLYLMGTAFIAFTSFGMADTGTDIRGMAITVLGNIIIAYVDLVIVCTSFLLLNRMRRIRGQT